MILPFFDYTPDKKLDNQSNVILGPERVREMTEEITARITKNVGEMMEEIITRMNCLEGKHEAIIFRGHDEGSYNPNLPDFGLVVENDKLIEKCQHCDKRLGVYKKLGKKEQGDEYSICIKSKSYHLKGGGNE